METKTVDGYEFVRYPHNSYSENSIEELSGAFYELMNFRRTIRDFSSTPVSRKVIENVIKTASTAPSGAHKQPWTFCVISEPALKTQIRKAAEEEEFENYHGRMPQEWVNDLKPLQTTWEKEFLEIAPYLIVVFKKSYDLDETGRKKNNYYATESVGIACGFLLSAIHNAGLCALTHTPSPMNFLSKMLNRPENEKPYLLIPVGFPAKDCYVPKLIRKSLEHVSVWY